MSTHQPDPFLAIEAALTPPARQYIRDFWDHANPHLRGAPVADILGMLHDGDAYLGLTELYWEQYGRQLANDLGAQGYIVGPATDAAVILLNLQTHQTTVPKNYIALVERISRAVISEAWATVDTR